MADSRLHQLAELGQSVWIDSLSREWLKTGELEAADGRGRRHRRHVQPDDLPEGHGRRGLVQRPAPQGARAGERRQGDLPAARDVRHRGSLRPHRARCGTSGDGKDGYVSMEVDPNLAYDTAATIDEAARFHDWVDRPNLYVKIPGHPAGAGRDRGDDRARPEHQRHADLLARPPHGGRRRLHSRSRAAGRGGRRPVDRSAPSPATSSRAWTPRPTSRLDEAGHPELKGKLAVANAKLAYQNYKEKFSGPRWEALAEKGATAAVVPLGLDVDEEPGLPRRALRRGADRPGDGEHDAATRRSKPSRITAPSRSRSRTASTSPRQVFEQLAAAGVDYADVTDTLEREGVQKFIDSFSELFEGIESKRGQLAPA